MEIFDIFKKLVNAHSPSGDESACAEVIRELVTPYADEITSDPLGNLIVRKAGQGKKLLFMAHMDTIGLIVTGYEENGFLRYSNLGYLDYKAMPFIPVRFKNGLRGVVALEDKTFEKSWKIKDTFIDIGARTKEEAIQMVKIGDTAVFDYEPKIMNGKIVSPYLDDKLGCAVLIKALMKLKECKNDTYFVFSVQEEVGTRGGKTAAYGIMADYAVAVDVTDTGDTPNIENKMETKLGGGPAVKIMDRSIICHSEVVQALEKCAQENDIAVQREIITIGGTDAGAIHTTGVGAYTGAVSICTRYIHSPQEVADLKDVEDAATLLSKFAERKL